MIGNFRIATQNANVCPITWYDLEPLFAKVDQWAAKVEAHVGLDDGEAIAFQHLTGPLLPGMIPPAGTCLLVFVLILQSKGVEPGIPSFERDKIKIQIHA